MRIPIAFSTDHIFVMQTGVCLFSLLDSAVTSKYDIYVMVNDDVTADDNDALRGQISKFDGHNIAGIIKRKLL